MKDVIYHNSQELKYRSPFGAVESGTVVSIGISLSQSLFPEEVILNTIKNSEEQGIKMSEKAIENESFFYSADIETQSCTGLMFYYFTIITSKGTFYYGDNHELLGGEGCICNENPRCYQITVYNNVYPVPEWFKKSVVYQIFPDRFYKKDNIVKNAKKNSFFYGNWSDKPFYIKDNDGRVVRWEFFGGDLKGIIEKLPYIKELGATAIYLNPIFEAASNHRYDTGNYKRIDPILGDEKDFINLCIEAEKIGIRILLDGVFSHTGDDSIYFNRYGNYPELGAYQTTESKYYKWYQFKEGTKEYKSWWGVDALPNVNEMESSYIDYIIEDEDSVIAHWMKKGAKGWRLDVADELPDDFIRLLKKKMKSIDRDSVLIGEVWEDASNKISYDKRREYFYGDELDSVTNYPLRQILIGFISSNINGIDTHRRIMSLYENYPRENFYSCLNLISGHDIPRILTVFLGYFKNKEEAIKALKLMIMIQMTFPGVPCVYYGDEAGLEGGTDPDNRRTYPWGKENKEIMEYYKEMITLRNNNEIFIKGEFQSLYIDEDIYGFIRSLNNETATILINPSRNKKELTVPYSDSVIILEPMEGRIIKE